MAVFKELTLALGFCSRLAPARMVSGAELGKTLPWLPIVGGILGVLLALPAWLGLLQNHPWILAWLLAAANIWLTRGLHWDGWADLWDGWGSSANGDTFWKILKDSHTGAFGVMGLVLGLAGQIVLFAAMLKAGQPLAIAWCLLWGRCAVPLLALPCRNLGRPGLGGEFLRQASWFTLLPVAGALVLGGFWLINLSAVALSLLLLFLFLLRLRSLAHKQRGCNGDFMGAAIVAGELSAGLGWVLAQ